MTTCPGQKASGLLGQELARINAAFAVEGKGEGLEWTRIGLDFLIQRATWSEASHLSHTGPVCPGSLPHCVQGCGTALRDIGRHGRVPIIRHRLICAGPPPGDPETEGAMPTMASRHV